MQIRVAGIDPNSLVNGPGLRYILYVQGCDHHCEGCHNPHTWPHEGGKMITVDEIIKDIESNLPLIKGVTLSGGDPMFQAEAIADLCEKIKYKLGLNIWCYTGYTFEEILKEKDIHKMKILDIIDTLVDGRFEIDKINGYHPYRGSSNQSIIHFKTADNILKAFIGEDLQ